MMTKTALISLALGMGALALTPASADLQDRKTTPDNWGYDIVDGKRVPKAKRQVNADGSWREERRTGDCTEVKERTVQGEIRITRTCDSDQKPD